MNEQYSLTLNKIKTCMDKYLITKSFEHVMEEIEVLSYRLIKELIKRDEKKLRKNQQIISSILLSENFTKSIFLASAECVLIHHDSADVLFTKIASKEYLDLDLFEFWKILNPLVNLVAIMDNNVSCFLYEIEVVLMTFLLWENSENFKERYNSFIESKDFVGTDIVYFLFIFIFY